MSVVGALRKQPPTVPTTPREGDEMPDHTCEAFTRGGEARCTRVARFDAYCPTAPPASENATMRLCTQHWNAYSLTGRWVPWPVVDDS